MKAPEERPGGISEAYILSSPPRLNASKTDPFFPFGRPTAHASFAKEEESSRWVWVCGKSKGVWGEIVPLGVFPFLLKGQRAIRGFEGRGRREVKYFDSRESDCRTRKENISVLFMNSLAKFRKKGAKIPSTPKFSSMKSLTRKIQKFCSFFAGNDRRWKRSLSPSPRDTFPPQMNEDQGVGRL